MLPLEVWRTPLVTGYTGFFFCFTSWIVCFGLPVFATFWLLMWFCFWSSVVICFGFSYVLLKLPWFHRCSAFSQKCFRPCCHVSHVRLWSWIHFYISRLHMWYDKNSYEDCFLLHVVISWPESSYCDLHVSFIHDKVLIQLFKGRNSTNNSMNMHWRNMHWILHIMFWTPPKLFKIQLICMWPTEWPDGSRITVHPPF